MKITVTIVAITVVYGIVYGLSYYRLSVIRMDVFCKVEIKAKYGIPIVWVVTTSGPNEYSPNLSSGCEADKREINLWTGRTSITPKTGMYGEAVDIGPGKFIDYPDFSIVDPSPDLSPNRKSYNFLVQAKNATSSIVVSWALDKVTTSPMEFMVEGQTYIIMRIPNPKAALVPGVRFDWRIDKIK